MKKVILCIFTLFQCLLLFGQEQSKRLPFVLLIDGDVPVIGIIEGSFLLKDTDSKVISSIPFQYQVGGLAISTADYQKLIESGDRFKMAIKFKRRALHPQLKDMTYEK